MALGLWMIFARRARCARCGLTLKLVKKGPHTRFKIDPEAWGRRCKALRPAGGPSTPFECPELKAATHRLRASDDASHHHWH